MCDTCYENGKCVVWMPAPRPPEKPSGIHQTHEPTKGTKQQARYRFEAVSDVWTNLSK